MKGAVEKIGGNEAKKIGERKSLIYLFLGAFMSNVLRCESLFSLSSADGLMSLDPPLTATMVKWRPVAADVRTTGNPDFF